MRGFVWKLWKSGNRDRFVPKFLVLQDVCPNDFPHYWWWQRYYCEKYMDPEIILALPHTPQTIQHNTYTKVTIYKYSAFIVSLIIDDSS